jgi:hypothetical protein
MARGFESKDVEFQQAESERRPVLRRTLTATERDEAARRQSLELAMARARTELTNATSAAHRKMLEQAVAELERQIGRDA